MEENRFFEKDLGSDLFLDERCKGVDIFGLETSFVSVLRQS